MNKRERDQHDGILALLDAASDYDETADEARASLEAEGVNVSAFLASVRRAVEEERKAERLGWQREAQAKRERFARTQANTQDALLPFAMMSRAELEAAVLSGDAAFHMNLEEQTDDDLRTILADRARLAELKQK